jgi:hypothetical protein
MSKILSLVFSGSAARVIKTTLEYRIKTNNFYWLINFLKFTIVRKNQEDWCCFIWRELNMLLRQSGNTRKYLRIIDR